LEGINCTVGEEGITCAASWEAGAAVFTNDKELKKKLSTRGVTVIHLRQRRRLDIASGKEF